MMKVSNAIMTANTALIATKKEEIVRPEGRRYGKLTVTGLAGSDKYGRRLLNVVCDCGQSFTATASNLTSGRTQSCGCLRRKDLKGKVFGRLTALRYHSSVKRKALWLCRCGCGEELKVLADDLVRGRVTDCGCGSKVDEPKLRLFTKFPVRETLLDSLLAGPYSKLK